MNAAWEDAPTARNWVAAVSEPAPGSGALLGTQLEPRYIARLVYEAGWNDAFFAFTSVAVSLAESQGWTRAIHVNKDGSRDRGIWQLNDVHKEITDEIAYDPVRATAAAFKLWAARRGWEDWAAYTSGVYLHDSYIGRAIRGLGNYIAEDTLSVPVPDWAGKPYEHRFTTPMLAYQHQVAGGLAHVGAALKVLGSQAASKDKVLATRTELGKATTALRASLPQT